MHYGLELIGDARGASGLLVSSIEAFARYQLLFRQGRSSTIALTSDDTRAIVVNRQKASVSVIRVRNADGSDASQLLAEVPVGQEPRFVAIAPNNSRAYVTNAVDGTLSVIDLTAATPVSAGTIDVLMEVGWVRPRGRRRAPGRPVTYGTTEEFLVHFGLESIKDLPGLAELKGSGLLQNNLPPDFTVPEPTDAAALMPDELPLDAGDDGADET